MENQVVEVINIENNSNMYITNFDITQKEAKILFNSCRIKTKVYAKPISLRRAL